jgi:acyl-coenzyme A thioesterase 13
MVPRVHMVDVCFDLLIERLQDELEITARVWARRGGYAATIVLVKNKATAELIAEGRHSSSGKHDSKMWLYGAQDI